MILYMLLLLLTALLAYPMGSISTLRVASRYVFRKNLRKLGKTDSLWFSNFRRIYKIPGILKLLAVELVKDLIPILFGALLLGFKGHADVGRAFAAFCLMMGRLWPMFNSFRGCRGSLPLIVCCFALSPTAGIISLLAVVLTTWFSRYPSLGAAVGGFVSVFAVLLSIDGRIVTLLGVGFCLMVLVRNFPGLRRIAEHEEERVDLQLDISYKFDEKF